eukprot:641059-Rhodomonas_salina.1
MRFPVLEFRVYTASALTWRRTQSSTRLVVTRSCCAQVLLVSTQLGTLTYAVGQLMFQVGRNLVIVAVMYALAPCSRAPAVCDAHGPDTAWYAVRVLAFACALNALQAQ